MQWSVISAVSDQQVLESCLLDSPGIRSASEIILRRGYRSAATAYNAGIQKATSDLLVFVHQDVYLPEGWIDSVNKAVAALSVRDPHWGVLGVWGSVGAGRCAGYLYWTGDRGFESPVEGPKMVVSLDEVVLILRKSSGLFFDERLPGFHMYGADICLEARRRGKNCYAISAFCIHNTISGQMLPWQFWKCYLFMRRKWNRGLPIDTPCTRISFWCWPMARWNLAFAKNVILRRQKRLPRVSNPGDLYRELLARGVVQNSGAQVLTSR